MEEKKIKPDYSVNQLVLIILAILTLGEFFLGVIATINIAGVMLLFGIAKAFFIVKDYMNIGRLFFGEENH